MRGRPKSFDEEEVVGRALEVFWQHGYEAASLSELLDRMGISRQSLYDSFGSKRGLFIRAIDHYRSTQLAHAMALLERPGSQVDNIEAVVRFFDALATDESRRGCLVANSVSELGGRDAQISAILDETLEGLRGALERALERSSERGEIQLSQSPRAIAGVLVNAMMGMTVLGRLPGGSTAVRVATEGTLGLLRG